MNSIRLLGLGPAQKADSQEQRICAAFLQPRARRGMQRQQITIQRFLGNMGKQFLVSECVECHVIQRRSTRTVHVDTAVTRVSSLHECRQWFERELRSV